MQKEIISKSLSVRMFNRQEYVDDNKKLYDQLKKILGSYTDNGANFTLHDKVEYVQNLNSELFIENLDLQLYFLYNFETPIAFVIYTKKQKETCWEMNAIFTHKEYAKLGFATILLRGSVKLMKKQYSDVKIKVSTTKQDELAINLFDSFSKVKDIKNTSVNNKLGGTDYTFDLNNVDLESLSGSIKDLAI